ncbi:MAG: DNA-binding protein, partial [bacterium]|nr:DNA-binding protein [bacterium]
MKRKDLQQLSTIRLREARALFAAGHFEGAYYLGGYVVECALKACVAKQTERYEFPDKKRANASHTHSIPDLVGLAGIGKELGQKKQSDLNFAANWRIVEIWSEQSRYERRGQAEAESLLAALRDRNHGVLRWL